MCGKLRMQFLVCQSGSGTCACLENSPQPRRRGIFHTAQRAMFETIVLDFLDFLDLLDLLNLLVP